LGFHSFIETNNAELIEEFACRGYRFEHSSDSDVMAFFKRVYLDNRALGEYKSEEIERIYDAIFSRKHQKSIWKTFLQFKRIINQFRTRPIAAAADEDIDVLKIALLESDRTYSESYNSIGSGSDIAVLEVFRKYGIEKPVVIKAELKLKEIDVHKTHITGAGSKVLRYKDIVGSGGGRKKDPADEMLFYLYGDINDESALNDERIVELFTDVIFAKAGKSRLYI